jgi:zinc D-Ala-D-Ala dipeptidase
MNEDLSLPLGERGALYISGINDPKLLAIPEFDNKEPLTFIKHPKIFKPSQVKTAMELEDGIMMLRRSVSFALIQAVNTLPEQLGVVFIEGYRPYQVQQALFDEEVNKIITSELGISKRNAIVEASAYVANPKKFAPHITGAAVDVALVEIRNGVNLCDVGNNTFAHDVRANVNFLGLTQEQRKNRELLSETMIRAGFTQYPFEFWHFSLGDRLDALAKRTIAKFGRIKIG